MKNTAPQKIRKLNKKGLISDRATKVSIKRIDKRLEKEIEKNTEKTKNLLEEKEDVFTNVEVKNLLFL